MKSIGIGPKYDKLSVFILFYLMKSSIPSHEPHASKVNHYLVQFSARKRAVQKSPLEVVCLSVSVLSVDCTALSVL
jgi:hypothetical protein